MYNFGTHSDPNLLTFLRFIQITKSHTTDYNQHSWNIFRIPDSFTL